MRRTELVTEREAVRILRTSPTALYRLRRSRQLVARKRLKDGTFLYDINSLVAYERASRGIIR